jgi:chromosome segregation ATPase
MQALWQAAVAVQLDEVVRLKNEARQVAERAEAARHDAELRVELLRVELADLREKISERDTDLANSRAEHRAARATVAKLESVAAALRQNAQTTAGALELAKAEHASAVAAIHTRYEGLSRQLLRETEHQRQAHSSAHQRLTQQLDDARVRLAALEGLREQLFTELATERDAHQRAAAEAAALATVVTEQHHALQALANPSAASPVPPTGRPRAARRRSAR